MFSRLLNTLLRIGTTIVLMYWVAPSLFGLLGMVAVATAFLTMLRNWGLGAAVIYHQVQEEAELRHLHLLAILMGILVAACLLLGQGWIQAYFNTSIPTVIFYAFALLILQEAFLHIPQTVLDMRGDFPLVGKVEIAAQIVTSLLAILLAFWGFPLMALLLRLLLGSLILVVYLSYYLPWIWRPRWQASGYWAKYFPFCWPFFLDGNLSFAVRNIDDALVGRLFGEAALGVYSRAYLLLLLPLSTVSIAIGRVYLPLLAARQERAQQASHFLAVVRMISSILFPPLAFIALNGSRLIDWLFAPDWAALGPLIQLFALLGMLYCIAVLEGTVFQALGKTKEQLTYAVPGKLLTLVGIVAASFYANSSWGIALGFAIGSMLYRLLIIYQMCRHLGISGASFFEALAPASAALAIAFVCYGPLFLLSDHHLWLLLGGGLLFAGTYVLAYAYLFPAYFKAYIRVWE